MSAQTKRQILMTRRSELYDLLNTMNTAYADLISGKIISYSLGNRTVTRSAIGLKDLHDQIRIIENEIDEIESILNGRSPRAVTRNSYLMPSFAPLYLWRK